MIVVPAQSLLGVDDEPASLDGVHPYRWPMQHCLRRTHTSWTRALSGPMTGAPIALSTYRASAEQRALLAIRDQHRRFPGYRMPARRCDIDHTTDWARGGSTDICNLSCLCGTHHTRKHSRGWSVRQKQRGVLEWTRPTGRRATDRPTPIGPVFTPTRVATMRQRAHKPPPSDGPQPEREEPNYIRPSRRRSPTDAGAAIAMMTTTARIRMPRAPSRRGGSSSGSKPPRNSSGRSPSVGTLHTSDPTLKEPCGRRHDLHDGGRIT